jgi:hypothetical protein
MPKTHRTFLLTFALFLLSVVPSLASRRTATITLGRNPEPPFCAENPGGTVNIFWNIQHTTTPDYVDYKLQDPTRTIDIEHEVYYDDDGLVVSRNWTIPPGSIDGKYWVRLEYHSYESGFEAAAEVTFYVCSSSGDVVAHKYKDANCNGALDPSDPPLANWWLCLESPSRERVCRRTDANGTVSWSGIPVGNYRIYELPVAGWTAVGPTSYQVVVQHEGVTEVGFLNYRYEECIGACCLADGSCIPTRAEQCAAQNGTFIGLGTTCTPNPCPPPTGACCLPDGTCILLSLTDCNEQAGRYLGNQTVCDPNPCPQPQGACCFTDGHCQVMYAAECEAQGGTYHGHFTLCNPNPCDQPMGACCFVDGHCTMMTTADCFGEGGTWQGVGVSCEPNPCPQPHGACCFVDGHCEVVTASECATAGGTYQGNDTACEPNPCPQPPEACCFPSDGHCEFMVAEDCVRMGGVPQGFGSMCNPNPCPQPPGACCFPNGDCVMMTEADCLNQLGDFLGISVACTPENPCPQPPAYGACCLDDQGHCVLLTPQQCQDQHGIYQGDNTTCEPENPCPITPARTTTWGRIKSTYR